MEIGSGGARIKIQNYARLKNNNRKGSCPQCTLIQSKYAKPKAKSAETLCPKTYNLVIFLPKAIGVLHWVN